MPGLPADASGFFREVPLDVAALESVQDELEDVLAAAGVPAAVRYRVRLVVEEVVSNLILHGRFAGPPPPARLQVAIRPAEVAIVVQDAAAPFDPRDVPDPVAPPSLLDDRVGGLGLALVRRIAEIRGYERLPEGWNRIDVAVRNLEGTQDGCR